MAPSEANFRVRVWSLQRKITDALTRAIDQGLPDDAEDLQFRYLFTELQKAQIWLTELFAELLDKLLERTEDGEFDWSDESVRWMTTSSTSPLVEVEKCDPAMEAAIASVLDLSTWSESRGFIDIDGPKCPECKFDCIAHIRGCDAGVAVCPQCGLKFSWKFIETPLGRAWATSADAASIGKEVKP
jgi:uncharacterized protein (UPF0212 family)